jgi:hypothetical protein
MYSLRELNCLFRFECAAVDNPRTARQRVLSVDLSSLDCQPERDATYLKMIRGLSKCEPTFDSTTLRAVGRNAVMAA